MVNNLLMGIEENELLQYLEPSSPYLWSSCYQTINQQPSRVGDRGELPIGSDQCIGGR